MKRLFSFIIICLIGLAATLPSWAVSDEEVNRVGNDAIALYQKQDFDGAFAELERATQMAPKNAAWRMNYGSLLFEHAMTLNKDARDAMMERSRKELELAVKYFKDNKEATPKSHCYFLLGDIDFYVRNDMKGAKDNYTKSLRLNKDHTGALEGINRWFAATGGKEHADPKKEQPKKEQPKKEPPKKEQQKKPASSNSLKDTITFKSGIVETGRILERDANGFWFEIEPGTKVYIQNSEIQGGPEEATYTACTDQDVVGDWKKIVVLRSATDKQPAEYFRFHANGLVQNNASFGVVEEPMVKTIFDGTVPNVKYKVERDGKIVMQYPDFPSPVVMSCQKATASATSKTYQTGDLRLIRYGQDGKSVVDEIVMRKN